MSTDGDLATRIQVSIYPEDLAALDAYARDQHRKNRSAAIAELIKNSGIKATYGQKGKSSSS